MLHHLWGKAQDHPDYDKREWVQLQSHVENLELLLRRLISAYRFPTTRAKDMGTIIRQAEEFLGITHTQE